LSYRYKLDKLGPDKLEFEPKIENKETIEENLEEKMIVNNNYKIEAIVNHQLHKKELQFKIRWKRYAPINDA
jgi:hypothetical protein